MGVFQDHQLHEDVILDVLEPSDFRKLLPENEGVQESLDLTWIPFEPIGNKRCRSGREDERFAQGWTGFLAQSFLNLCVSKCAVAIGFALFLALGNATIRVCFAEVERAEEESHVSLNLGTGQAWQPIRNLDYLFQVILHETVALFAVPFDRAFCISEPDRVFNNARIGTDNEGRGRHAQEQLNRFEILDHPLRTASVKVIDQDNEDFYVAVL